MKYTKIIITISLLTIIYACGNANENESKQNDDTTNVEKTEISENVIKEESVTTNSQIEHYKFQCLINNQLPVDITFEIKDDIIQGQIVYTETKDKSPILLLGEVIHSEDVPYELSFSEIAPDGTTTGQITGKINEQGKFEGTWSEPCKFTEEKTGFTYIEGKQFPISTAKIADKNTQLSSDKIFSWKTNTQNPEGKYYYSLGENCNTGTLKIFRKENQFLCTVNTTNSAPGFNMADVENQPFELQNNYFILTPPYSEECKFAVYPFDDFVMIKYISNGIQSMDCGFGNNATISGIFLKIK